MTRIWSNPNSWLVLILVLICIYHAENTLLKFQSLVFFKGSTPQTFDLIGFRETEKLVDDGVGFSDSRTST